MADKGKKRLKQQGLRFMDPDKVEGYLCLTDGSHRWCFCNNCGLDIRMDCQDPLQKHRETYSGCEECEFLKFGEEPKTHAYIEWKKFTIEPAKQAN